MENKVTVEKLDVHGDMRGYVFEPVDTEDLKRQRNCHIAVTEPGEIRGNHYHRDSSEIITMSGPMLVRYRENGQIRDFSISSGEVYRFRIPPGTAHAMRNTGTSANVLVAFNSAPHDRSQPDTIPDVLIP